MLLLSALLILGGAFVLKQHLANVPQPAPETSTPAAVPASNILTTSAPPSVPVAAAPIPAPPVPTNNLTPEQQEDAIDSETDRLQQWSASDNPADLANILADLNNPEKEIREAAIEAAKQFGSAKAIPALKAAANNTDDTGEKIAFLEAADFLSLPGMDFNEPAPPRTPEQIQADEQEQARRKARRDAKMQSTNPNPNSQASPDQNSPAGSHP